MRLWRRFWDWYFWGTPPTCYGWPDGQYRLRAGLWNVCHPQWVRRWRHALLVLNAEEAAAEAGALRQRYAGRRP